MEVETFPSNLVKYVSSLSSLLRRALPKLPPTLLLKKILGVDRVEALEEQGQGREQKEGREQNQRGEQKESTEQKERMVGIKYTRGQSASSE